MPLTIAEKLDYRFQRVNVDDAVLLQAIKENGGVETKRVVHTGFCDLPEDDDLLPQTEVFYAFPDNSVLVSQETWWNETEKDLCVFVPGTVDND